MGLGGLETLVGVYMRVESVYSKLSSKFAVKSFESIYFGPNKGGEEGQSNLVGTRILVQ